MHSLDDLYYFYLVVKHGGFSAASQATDISKTTLSRRIDALEKRYRVKLIERSTRHFKVTALGQQFYSECSNTIQQAECAHSVLLKERTEVSGLIRISCPPLMMQFQIRDILHPFLKQYPQVSVEIELSSRRVDVIHDEIDIAIRTNFEKNHDSSLIVRPVIQTVHGLVASPALVANASQVTLENLASYPVAALGTYQKSYGWKLNHQHSGEQHCIAFEPRIKCSDLHSVHAAVMDGLGIADLPLLVVAQDIKAGRLLHLLPDWQARMGTVELVYTSRQGKRLVVELLIEHLISGLQQLASTQEGYVAGVL